MPGGRCFSGSGTIKEDRCKVKLYPAFGQGRALLISKKETYFRYFSAISG
jgi:hypothetical protein